MQIMAEALGLMLPGSALMPATSKDLRVVAREAGKQSVWLAEHDLTPDKIVTMKSFENAIMVHAAISGSTNSLLHLPAIAREFGIEIDGDTFDRLHRGAHYLLNIRPAGEWPAQFFYYAGGVPTIMEEIKDMLHLDVMTVTGKTLGENLEELDVYKRQAVHCPHIRQSSSMILAFLFFSSMLCAGHAFTHIPQPTHLSVSIPVSYTHLCRIFSYHRFLSCMRSLDYILQFQV